MSLLPDASTAVHGSYVRRPADLPAVERVVQFELRVRRFCSRNTECSRRTFAERPSRLLAARARRTRRPTTEQCAVAVTVGAEAKARLLKPLAVPSGLNSAEAATLARIQRDKDASRVVTLTRQLCELVRSRYVSQRARRARTCKPFEACLDKARGCGGRATTTARLPPTGPMSCGAPTPPAR